MFRSRSTRHRQAQGREPQRRVRRTIRRALEAGSDRIGEIVWTVSAQMAGRATRPLVVIPVPVQAGTMPPRHEPASGGCFSVWVASPSATR